MYLKGLGVPQDYQKAVYWFKKSAEQDYPLAEINLALIYQYGLGVPQDSQEALYWYNKAMAHKNKIQWFNLNE